MINQWMEWMGYNGVAYFKTNPFLYISIIPPLGLQADTYVMISESMLSWCVYASTDNLPEVHTRHSLNPHCMGPALISTRVLPLTTSFCWTHLWFQKRTFKKKTCCGTHVTLAMSNHLISSNHFPDHAQIMSFFPEDVLVFLHQHHPSSLKQWNHVKSRHFSAAFLVWVPPRPNPKYQELCLKLGRDTTTVRRWRIERTREADQIGDDWWHWWTWFSTLTL